MTTDHLEQNATENAGVSKIQGWKSRHQNAGVEIVHIVAMCSAALQRNKRLQYICMY